MTTRRGRVGRRTLLGAGGAAVVAAGLAGAGVERGILPGRPALQAALGLDGPAGRVPDVAPGPVVSGTLRSPHRPGVDVAWAVTRPPQHPDSPLPVVVALHGLGVSVDDLMGDELGLPRFLAAGVTAGAAPFALAAVDGGRSYWHPHAGEDAGAMVVDDLLPLLSRLGLAAGARSRVGLLGWSMGGYGALRLGGLLGASRVSAVAAVSPALWEQPGDASPAGFSDPAEYERYSVLGRQHDLDGVAVRLDCGTGDPFYRAVQHYADDFAVRRAGDPPVRASFAPGAHAAAYWRRVLPGELTWLAAHLDPVASTR